MRKPQNSEHIAGRLYQHDLTIKQVSNENSKNYGKDFISGNLEVATDEEGLNVIKVHFTYVSPETSKGTENRTYTVLKQIIEKGKTWVADGKDNALMLRIDTALALSDFYNSNDELVSVKTNEGGFVTIVNNLEDENLRNTFSVDMVITGVTHVDKDETRNIEEHDVVKGAIFNFRNALLPLDFNVRSKQGMEYFEGLGASNSQPIYTRVWGKIISKTVVNTQEIESAFGEPAVRSFTNTNKEWEITGTAKIPYDFGDEKILTAEELQKASQDRQVYLADVKKRADEYRANRNANNETNTTVAAAKTGEFVF